MAKELKVQNSPRGTVIFDPETGLPNSPTQTDDCEVEEKEELPKINWSNMEFSPTQTDDWDSSISILLESYKNGDMDSLYNICEFIRQLLATEKARWMKEWRERIEKILTRDLDVGKFGSICSNETSFKNYLLSLLND